MGNKQVVFKGARRRSISFDEARKALSALVLAWANDSFTGTAKYILEVETGKRCGCVCPGCGGGLEAVNSRNPRWKVRPHFRHSDGPQVKTCSIHAARIALLRTLTEIDAFELPGRRKAAVVTGLSGATYVGEASAPSFVAAPEAVLLVDSHQALVTLTDGRELVVEVQASLDRPSDVPASQRAVISIVSDDPEIAALAPDELRARLRILILGGTWCQQWSDVDLEERALSSAVEQSKFHLDAADAKTGITTYEGALHRAVKEILAQHLWMQVPGLSARVSRKGVADQEWLREWATEPQRLTFTDVRLEARVGRSVPDVVATGSGGPVCVEVTVTNPLTDERERRYCEIGLPVVELDLRAFSGRVTRGELVNLVLTDIRFKRWAYHPKQVSEHQRMLEEFQAEVGRYMQLGLTELVNEAKKLALEWYDSDYADHRRAPLVQVLEHLEARGLHGAAGAEFYGHHAILPRLLTIALGRPVGYHYSSVFEVVNALTAVRNDGQRWSTLYLMAIKQFAPPMSMKHKEWVANWRTTIRERMLAKDPRVDRPRVFDRVIAAFFPEMKLPLTKSLKFGTHSIQAESSRQLLQDTRPRSLASESDDEKAKWAAIINGKKYSEEELHEYLFGK